MSADARMGLREALVALRAVRRDDDVVVTTMGVAREWMALGTHPLDLVLVPSSMGQATSYGLGLALAQPRRRVVVVNGDGSMLMNLGSLVSIVAAAPPNLVVILLDNGVYEVTGAQPVPGAGRVDFAALARACGLRAVHRYAEARRASRSSRPRSAAGPGERGPGRPGSGSVSSVTKVGPGVPNTSGTAASHAASSEYRCVRVKPQPSATIS